MIRSMSFQYNSQVILTHAHPISSGTSCCFNKLSVQNSNHTYKRSSRKACKQALHTLHRCNRKSCQMYFLNLHQVYSSQHSGPVRSTHRNYGKYSSNLKKTVPLEMTTKLACFLGWIEPAYLN